MGRHERREDAENQWPGEHLLARNSSGAPHDGKHRREDASDEDRSSRIFAGD